jgi:hypothetical protein
MKNIPLVILAGYSQKPKILTKLAIGFSYIFNHERYLWDVEKSVMLLKDKSLLEIMLENIEDSKKIDRTVYVVGTENVGRIVEDFKSDSIDVKFVPQGESLGENMALCYDETKTDGHVLFLTSDLPEVHGKDIDEMLDDINFTAPLILSYIKSSTLSGLERRFLSFYDGEQRFRAKESNVVFGNGKVNFLELNKLYNIRKMMNPNNWVKAINMYVGVSGLRGTFQLGKKIVSDLVTKKAVDFNIAISVLGHLINQEVAFYEIKNPVFSEDVDSEQDLQALGYK